LDNFSIEEIKDQIREVLAEILAKADLFRKDIFVVGLSTSEVVGGVIGQNSSRVVGRALITEIYDWARRNELFLAVQGCEHINRALVVEEELALAKGFEIVDVLPSLDAGGSGQLAAFELFNKPVEVEQVVAKSGIDIGETSIGMHVRHVQIPLRLSRREIGAARVLALTSRAKKIGGERARYGKWQALNEF